MGRDKEYPLTAESSKNLDKLLESVNKFLVRYGKEWSLSSGYRPGHYNTQVDGAARSSHVTCEAVDLHDASRDMTRFILANPGILVDCGLYMESPTKTVSWVHLQTRATKNRIFNP